MGAVFLGTADACSLSIGTVLARAGRAPSDVDFLCVHQGTAWLREVVAAVSGVTRARSVETHAETGYIFASTIPAALSRASQSGALTPGNLAILVGGGPGQTYGATLLSWS
jgi:3-oxoacyl-[acyl-carrier-protein] synthase-3